MTVNTGASTSVVAKKRLQELLPTVPVAPSEVLLQSYPDELTRVHGKADIEAQFCDKKAVFLTGHGSPSLLGRNWIPELGVDVSAREVNVHSLSDIKTLVHEFSAVFEEGLGTFKGDKATIHVPQDMPPKFFKSRPLPLDLKD